MIVSTTHTKMTQQHDIKYLKCLLDKTTGASQGRNEITVSKFLVNIIGMIKLSVHVTKQKNVQNI